MYIRTYTYICIILYTIIITMMHLEDVHTRTFICMYKYTHTRPHYEFSIVFTYIIICHAVT